AVNSLTSSPGRQALVLYVGDGGSTLNPIKESDRASLARQMAERHIQFFAVPVGPAIDGRNLHALATATGGAVVRIEPNDTAEVTVKRLQGVVQQPVLYPERVEWSVAMGEVFPTQLPPLRSDVPTLVLGHMPKAAAKLECKIA